jgi:hypothetical protein
MSKKLEILKNSLAKKETEFSNKLSNHIDTVKQANGQPLNDKGAKGRATLNKWERQNDSLRTLKKSIEKTIDAVEREESKIRYVGRVKETLPQCILDLVDKGELTIWQKYPHILFVSGVEKARIIYDKDKNTVLHKFLSSCGNQEQYKKFASIYNSLYKQLKSEKA